ncbi:discoidin domain-containing protein [Brevibacillus sp. BC25]|uniref:discoidin domain-containing protein n=1 Tax=Brevibacillus sp. BC25 TaxID=1144308 RepID=UPI00027128F1|nr:discoidin domain-containing protein [Brevibacillus sp. BC25]EJL29928.1 putative carbohydrate binding protein [Brevibacillus sp. BC25]
MNLITKFLTFVFAFALLLTGQNLAFAEDQYSDDLVPKLTSNTSAPPIVIEEDNYFAPYAGWKVFDDNTDSFASWYTYLLPSDAEGHFVIVDFGAGNTKKVQKINIKGYHISSSSKGSSVKDWKFYGSNDKTTWTLLSNDTYPNVVTTQSYEFNNDTSYRYYRLNILNSYFDPTGKTIGLNELELFEKSSTTPIDEPVLSGTAGNAKNTLSWDAVTGATGYILKRSTTPGGPYTTIASNVTGTTYTDTDVTNGTTYYYVVTAINDDGESGNSNEVALTPTDTTTPTGNRALLVISLTDGSTREYDLSINIVNDFVSWYEGKQSEAFVFTKEYNIGPFTSRQEYISQKHILSFEVKQYSK